MGSPRFLGEPHWVHAPLSSDPGGISTPGRSRRFDAAFRQYHGVGSLNEMLSGLNDAACTLAVYASQGESPHHHARLASGWWPAFAGQDFLLLGPLRRVSDMATSSLPPSPGLPWRKILALPHAVA
jgi:hypothetical protein